MRNALGPALAAALLFVDAASAQTFSLCNPLQSTGCPANPALNMAINIDFRKSAVNSFAASGSPSYGLDGVSFAVAKKGDAPQLSSIFYIMFGRVEITMKAAPGTGIVSALVLQSDDLDEIDMEWLGARPDEMQTNYFGKGLVTTFDRGQMHRVEGTQKQWIKYTIDWTKDRIVWMAGSTVLRVLKSTEAETNQYPQTPMQVRLGAWAGGDPSNAPDTIKWAGGQTDYTKGPYPMHVQSIAVTDYSTGKSYRYRDSSGTWQSIIADGGAVNGNYDGGRHALDVKASTTVGGTKLVSVPVGGLGRDDSSATRTQTGWPWVAGASPTSGSIPDGWRMTPEGKIMRNNNKDGAAAPSLRRAALRLAAACLGLVLVCLW